MATLSDKIVLREEDAAEVAAGGLTPEQAVLQSIELSTAWFTIDSADGEVLAYWGFRKDTAICAHAYLWLLSTPAVEHNKVLFTRATIDIVDFMFKENYRLTVAVHAEYFRAIKWLEWLGFKKQRVLGNFIEMSALRGGAA